MAKLYTQIVQDCAECPNLAHGSQSYWCPMVAARLDAGDLRIEAYQREEVAA